MAVETSAEQSKKKKKDSKGHIQTMTSEWTV